MGLIIRVQHLSKAQLGAEDEVFSGGVEQILIRAIVGTICPGGSAAYSGEQDLPAFLLAQAVSDMVGAACAVVLTRPHLPGRHAASA